MNDSERLVGAAGCVEARQLGQQPLKSVRECSVHKARKSRDLLHETRCGWEDEAQLGWREGGAASYRQPGLAGPRFKQHSE